MAPTFTRGARVRHTELGIGTVRAASAAAAMLRVRFDLTGTDELVAVSTLTIAGDKPAVTAAPASPATPHARSATQEEARSRRVLVESLRQGLPPPGGLVEWTVGHRKARAALEEALARAKRGGGAVILARAPYGDGKTHLSRLGAELARAAGLVTMHVELDGDGMSFASGHRVLAALLGSMRLPADQARGDRVVPGLGALLERAARLRGSVGNAALDLFEPFLADASKWLDSDDAIEVLERYLAGDLNRSDASAALVSCIGAYIPLPSFRMAYGTRQARKAAQAAQLARVVELARATGCRGGFVAVDELDHDLATRDGRVLESLHELARVTEHVPLVLLLLCRETADLEIDGAVDVRLEPLSEVDLAHLVERTIDAFALVYACAGLQRGRAELLDRLRVLYAADYARGGWGPRFFVRATIEACELVRLDGLSSLADVPIP